MRKSAAFLSAIVVFSLLASGLTLAAPSVTGALHLTDSLGSHASSFADKGDVYLKGNNLPSGYYYVRITNSNGSVNLGVPPVDGTLVPVSKVTVDPNGQLHELYRLWDIVVTPGDGEDGFLDSPNGGTYKVWLSQDPTFPNSASKTKTFGIEEECEPFGHLQIVKFYDYNLNGRLDVDEGEQILPGWLVHVVDGIDWWEYTGDTINPLVLVLPFDTYTISEATPDQSNWVPTTPKFVYVVLDESNSCGTAWFGNVCLGCGGGRTLGFWSNKNGKKAMEASNGGVVGLLGELRALGGESTPLLWKFPDGNDHATFSSWLLGATANEMGYMLSAQLAAMKLGVLTGLVGEGDYVYCPEVQAPYLGFTVEELMQKAVDALADMNSTRQYLEALKTALDNANNNLTFVQKFPCPYDFVNTEIP